jgi:N-carbamoyl-L-amino-acid hydrolase
VAWRSACFSRLAAISGYIGTPSRASLVAAAAASQKLEAAVEEFWYFPPTPFDPKLVGAVREAAAAQGYNHQDIISGAGHDAVYMARIAPTAMIFVPCVGGISHNEIEDAKPEDLTAGCNVLLNAVLDTADSAG